MKRRHKLQAGRPNCTVMQLKGLFNFSGATVCFGSQKYSIVTPAAARVTHTSGLLTLLLSLQ